MKKTKGRKKVLLWLAGARVALGIVAIPLAPVLYDDHFLILVLMRPTKEVLLAGAFQARRGEVVLWQLLAAAIPLTVLGVWHFYYLGRQYSKEINTGQVPGIGSRILPHDKIKKLAKVLKKKGGKLVFIGRLAAFPSALVAAAAGSSNMKSREFLVPDGVGALAAIVEVVGAGYLLAELYERVGGGKLTCKGFACLVDPKFWASPKTVVAVAGVVALGILATLLGRYLRSE